jgi:uncharacterized protein
LRFFKRIWLNRRDYLTKSGIIDAMKRYLDEIVIRDLERKMVVLTGPRQVGKTTLSRQLLAEGQHGQYLNFDTAADRKVIVNQAWNPASELVVFDELHKMPRWKAWLKGVYDGKPSKLKILVTGSARLDFLKKSGDSLAGRFFGLRLHPISVAELSRQHTVTADYALTLLLARGGFPEAALARSLELSDRWRLQYLDGLIREDILEFSKLHEVNTMRVLVDLLRERVGSPLSVASLARDLSASTTTINRYLQVLEALYIIFTVKPWHKNIARSLLKAPKVYFYDTGMVRGDEGLRFENLVATHLLKWVHYQQDVLGKDTELHYVRTKDGAEIDFSIVSAKQITQLIECKLSDTKVHPALKRFSQEHPTANSVQLVRHAAQSIHYPSITIEPADQWLNKLI